MPKPKIFVIVGPTASGKSELAVEIARKLNGEIVSADSRQVYKGLDIGSGKITREEMKGIPHHLLDVVSPKKVFSVSDYQRLASETIEDIIERGKTPILVGGTGFYIKAIVDGLVLPEVSPDPNLRKSLNRKSVEELFNLLKKLDQKRASAIDEHNKVRLVRAIEIATALGKVPTIKKKKSPFTFVIIGLKPPDDLLQEKIHTRLLGRLKKGMVKEVKNLHAKGISWKRLESLGLEYRYIALFLQGKLSKKEMTKTLEKEIWRYAKRQMTWFKKDKRIIWFLDSKGALKFLL